jgi:hypothetical protein
MDGTIDDALLVPVSVSYEKLVDGNFVREQLGQPKQMETFWATMKSIWSVLNSNYGMTRIDFNQPFSLRVSHKMVEAIAKVEGEHHTHNIWRVVRVLIQIHIVNVIRTISSKIPSPNTSVKIIFIYLFIPIIKLRSSIIYKFSGFHGSF